ncbi:MAG: SLOG family protein [Minisyncoccia bacterium]
MIIAITGHRPQKLLAPNVERTTRGILHWAFQTMKPTWVISGMALGVDQWAAEEAMLLDIPVLAAIPCLEQEKFWGPRAKETYHTLLAKAKAKEFVTQGPYTKGCMQQRNQWMVDRAQALVAVFDGTAGGTANCVRYALEHRAHFQRQLPILRFDPSNSKSEWL